MKLPKTKPRTQGVAPFAYDADVENKQFVRNESKYKILKDVVEGIVSGAIKSIREGRIFIEAKGYTISVQALSKYVKDEREATGSPGKYNYSSKNKAKIADRQSIRAKQIRVEKLDKKLKSAKSIFINSNLVLFNVVGGIFVLSLAKPITLQPCLRYSSQSA